MWRRLKRKPSRSGASATTVTVGIIGNPNAGKTAVFNRLTGLAQKVGNYPGVTVERKEGHCLIDGVSLRLLDLPGTYSLAAHSPDEMVAVDVLLGYQKGEPRPQLVLQVIDASNLERNLYLLSQVLETGLPVVVALNMMDVAEARGIRLDVDRLSSRLGVPIIPVQAHRGSGLTDLRKALSHAGAQVLQDEKARREKQTRLPIEAIRPQVAALQQRLGSAYETARGSALHEVGALRALIDRGGQAERRLLDLLGDSCLEQLNAIRAEITVCMPLAAFEAGHRYSWIRERVEGCANRSASSAATWSERVDRVLTHRVFGFSIFALLMLVVFQSIFTWSRPLMEGIEAGFAFLQASLNSALPAGPLQSLLSDGLIAGVGMVAMFLPQILVLFLFIGILEDCGYMARAAFLMDKIMSKCGLSGKSFVPMLSGFACAVPGILAARVIEDRRDRFATMLVTPLMSCSARLPVYSVFIGTFVPSRPVIPGILDLQALTLFGLYILGVVTAVVVAWVLRKTLLRGARPPFVLELPSYKWPAFAGLLIRLKDRGQEFLVRAGTVILAIAVIVWALAYFPHSSVIEQEFAEKRSKIEATVPVGEARVAALQNLHAQEAGSYLADSYFGRMGRLVEPVFKPLGWDWRISMSVLASFPAREVFVSSLGTVFQMGESVDEGSVSLREGLRRATWGEGTGSAQEGALLFSLPVALSILVFFALCCQCAATVVTLGRETRSWLWAVFGFSYMTVLAYVGALVAYNVSRVLGA